ncbi:MAG TPA: Ig-like domain-containing protein [Hyphomicrobium sp.]|nr:Ig-like domain-containing protein [Hyphomicrobium sp.]
MGTIRVEFVPIKKYKLGLLGLDHLQIVYEDENSFINKQDNWYVLEGTHDGALLSGQLGVLGEEFFTELAAANGSNGAELVALIGTPQSRGSRVVYTGSDALSLWQSMMDYGKEIQAQEFPYEGLAWPFSPGAIMNSSSVVATLLYAIGIDVNANMPFGVRNSPGTATLLGTSGPDEITLGGNFTQAAAGFGDDTLRGTETLLWPEKFFGGLDDDTIIWSKGENIVHGGEARTPYEADGFDTIDYSGAGLIHIVSTRHAVEHKVADFISTFEGGSDQLLSIEAISWNRETDVVTVGEGVNLLEKPIKLNLDDAAGGKGDQLGFLESTSPLLVNVISAGMISIQTIANQGQDAGYWAQSVEWLAGSSGDDRIYAGASLMGVEGGQGNDVLDARLAPAFTFGSPLGYDIELYGQDGDDILVSGAGYSMAEGGAGADTFIVSTMAAGVSYPEFVITDAGSQDKLFIPYDYFKQERGEFDGSELMQLRGAPFKMDDITPVSLFFWGIPDDNMVQGFIEFVGMIQYYMDGSDLIISIMMGDVERHQRDYGPGEPPGPVITTVVGDGSTETIVRVVDWQEGDLGITFPIAFDGQTFNDTGFADYPGFADAIRSAVSPSAFIGPLEARPEAHVPQDILASAEAPVMLRALSAFTAPAAPTASEGDDVISMPTGGPYKIHGLGGNDTITGSAGSDYIDGGAGDDIMAGGRGNDAYVVDSPGDIVIEEARGGFDHVYASIDYTLGAELEHLTLTENAVSGTGNALRNTLAGNDRDNILSGGAGDDTLAGNRGDDTLIGGEGSDGYVYELGDGHDTIVELASDAGVDVLVLASGIRPEDLLFLRNPSAMDDLVVRFVQGGSITILDYFAAPGTIEGVEFTSGLIWDPATFGNLAQSAAISSNSPPAARDDAYVFAGPGTFRLPVAALLDNDADPDGDAVSISAIGSIIEGAAVLEGDEIVVTASLSPMPRAVFDYVVSDGRGGGATARAEIIFWPNSAPIITASTLGPVHSAPAHGQVLATDADNDVLFYSLADGAGPSLGTVEFAAGGAFTYRPFAGASGEETFTILVRDIFDASDAHTFSFTIASSTNTPPVITSAALGPVIEDQAASGYIVAQDDDGDALTFAVDEGEEPSKGTLSIASDGTFTYTPRPDANGPEIFSIVVTDGRDATARHTFTFEIAPVNDAPAARDDTGFSVDAGRSITLDAAALLGNDTDADGDALAIASVGNAVGGAVELLADGNVKFTAGSGYSGQASFSYAASDGTAQSAPANVYVDVSAPTPAEGIVLTGTNCADRIVGTDLNDVIYGRKGNDILIGRAGDDTFKIRGNDGLDRFDGGPGYDVIEGSDANDVLRVLSRLANLKSIEEIDGGRGNNDRIVATSGNDVLDFSNMRLSGIERIVLGAGNDWVLGSPGNDTFAGGSGRDVFAFGPGSGHDVVTDFKVNAPGKGKAGGWLSGCALKGDVIDLRLYEFNSYNELRQSMHQSGRNVVIDLEAGSSITLEQTRIADLSAWDFRL